LREYWKKEFWTIQKNFWSNEKNETNSHENQRIRWRKTYRKWSRSFVKRKKLRDFKSNATKFYLFIAKNRVIIVFLLTYLIFFCLFWSSFSFFFYISTSLLSSSILSELDITHLLNFLILSVSMNNLKSQIISQLTKYLSNLSNTLIINDSSQKDLNRTKWIKSDKIREKLTRVSRERIHV
jgi:hypothetical protein